MSKNIAKCFWRGAPFLTHTEYSVIVADTLCPRHDLNLGSLDLEHL